MSNQNLIDFSIKQLHPCNLAEVLWCQKIVHDDLAPDNKNFIITKTAAQFEDRMTKHGIMFGYFDHLHAGSPLVAYSVLALPDEAWPVADMILDPKELPCAPHELGVFQNSVVLPSHRNQKIHQFCICTREVLASKNGRPHMMGEIAAANPASLKGFLNFGFHVAKTGIDPDDGCQLLYVYKKHGADHGASPIPTKSVFPADPKDFKKLTAYLKDGYKGTMISKAKGPGSYILHLAPSL